MSIVTSRFARRSQWTLPRSLPERTRANSFFSLGMHKLRVKGRCWNRLKDFGREGDPFQALRPTLWDAIIKDPTKRTREPIVRLSRCYPVNAQCIIWTANKERDFSTRASRFLRFPVRLYGRGKNAPPVKIRCYISGQMGWLIALFFCRWRKILVKNVPCMG